MATPASKMVLPPPVSISTPPATVLTAPEALNAS